MNINGRKIAEEILAGLNTAGKNLSLAAVLVGKHEGSKKFLELKERAAKKIGIGYEIYKFPEIISTEELAGEVARISRIESNQGVLVELPLPAHLDTQKILNQIPIEKDVDVLSQVAQGVFFAGKSEVLPPAVEAVKIIFEKHNINLASKNCVVFGYGLLVGRQVSHWLAQQQATVTVVNELTADAKSFSVQADIVISGVGKPDLITADMVKDGAILIDFGYENQSDKIRGDIDFDAVAPKASLITPVPGGVGPVVIAAVLKNLVELSRLTAHNFTSDPGQAARV